VNWIQIVISGIAALFVVAPTPVSAEEKDLSEIELAKQDQNPVTRFYVMRFEDNVQLGFGPDDEPINFFRIQPLIPIELGKVLGRDWTLLTRAIIPIAHVPWPESKDGLSDISLIAFLTPSRSGNFVWGMGPAFLLPTATDDLLGTGKWSAGPAAAGIYMNGPWVVGAIAQNLWSFAGDDDRSDVDAMTLRPIVNYNLPHGWYLTSSPSIAANWEADADERWLVPVGGGVGKVYSIGRQRMSTTIESYYHAVSPSIGPEWQLRVQHSFLYPEKRPAD
jgi:hypothetical protein